jgi:nucleoside-diphosphate-sugar epimerase
MRILLTGATGYIGSAVLDELLTAGHDVTAVVRSEDKASAVEAKGARAAVGDAADAGWLAGLLDGTDAVIHTAASDDPVALNTAVADAVEQAYAGTSRRLVLTSGVWIYGSGDDINDDDVPNPVDLVAWRVPIEDRLLAGPVSTTVIVPGVVYGGGESLLPIARAGVGDGAQHWTWVHVDDLARLYRLAVEHPDALGRVIASDGAPTTVAAVAGADAVTETADAAQSRLSPAFADALLLDQQAFGAKARALGWDPRVRSVRETVAAE